MARPRGGIISDKRGKPPGVDALVRIWTDEMTHRLLHHVWEAYDRFYSDLLSDIDWTEDYEQLERNISWEFVLAINNTMDKFLPCTVQHSPPEFETRSSRAAKPPEYDIAFVWKSDPRLMWPLEAKIVKTDNDIDDNLRDYIQTLRERFLMCKYAPFSNGGAMLCYFKAGDITTLLGNIERRLECALPQYSGFPDRPHRISEHVRTVPPEKAGTYPAHFRCHHIIMLLSNSEHTPED